MTGNGRVRQDRIVAVLTRRAVRRPADWKGGVARRRSGRFASGGGEWPLGGQHDTFGEEFGQALAKPWGLHPRGHVPGEQRREQWTFLGVEMRGERPQIGRVVASLPVKARKERG